MKSSSLPVLGEQIAQTCALFIDLKSLLRQNLASMELVFYPDDGSRQADPETKGKGAFQFGDKTPLVWTCTFGDFKRVVALFDFRDYNNDKLAFQNPVRADALSASAI